MKDRFGAVALASLAFAGTAFAGGSVFPPPPGARVINFEDFDAPPYFVDTTALRDRYAPLGVTFSAPGNDGGAVLDDTTSFGVTGYSGHNFLAFNVPGPMSDGGIPQLPETLTFRHPVRYVQFNVGDGSGSTVTLKAYDAEDNLIGTSVLGMSGQIQTLSIQTRHIAKVVISSDGNLAVIDDLAFVLDSTVIDFDDAPAPTGFVSTTALRDRYQAKGIFFVGISNEGGAILDEGSMFFVSGYSPPNFLAFNQAAPMMDGGLPQFPQYILLQPPAKHIEFLVGDPTGHTFKAEAYDFNANLVDTAQVVGTAAMQTLAVDAPSISTLVISANGQFGVIDDLSFDQAGTVIDFDDAVGAPGSFIDTTALRDRYAPLGVSFAGGGPKDGAGILEEGGGFGVGGKISEPNILAFNQSSQYSDGGSPELPEVITFDQTMRRVEFRTGSAEAGRVSVEVYNAVDHLVGTNFIDLTSKMQSLIMPADGITKMVVTSTAQYAAIDDLAFQPENPCTHDACYYGDQLDHNCSPCVTKICADNPDCCGDGWVTVCAKAVNSLCGIPCAILCGDANDDRRVTAPDALSALKTAVGSATCSLTRCDFTGDGKILSRDALGILQTSVGQMTAPKCPPEDPV